MLEFYTSYWNHVARIDTSEYLIVQISNSRPKWFDKPVVELPQVYPSWNIVKAYKDGKITAAEYVEQYVAGFPKGRTDNCLQLLEHYASVAGKKKVVLVCWESPGKFCHRYKCGQLLTGQICPELS